RSRSCRESATVYCVAIRHVQIEHARHRLITALRLTQFQMRITDLHRHVMNHSVGRSMAAKLFSSESAFQEVNDGNCAQRMQIRLHVGSAFPLVALTLESSDVPIIPIGVPNGR